MNYRRNYCSYCSTDVSKDADSCPICKHIFINNVAGIKKVESIRSKVNKTEKTIKLLLVFTLIGLFLSSFFVGGIVEFRENEDLIWLLLGIGGLVVIISLVGIVFSCQNMKFVKRMRRRTTIISKYSGEDESEGFIYEYYDAGAYKWICGFCDSENTKDEVRCPICGYLRMQH